MVRNRRGPLPRPIEPAQMDSLWDERERFQVQRMLAASACGDPRAVRAQLDALLARTQADELIVTCALHDHADRLRSYELLAGLREAA